MHSWSLTRKPEFRIFIYVFRANFKCPGIVEIMRLLVARNTKICMYNIFITHL
jgi:hypothetical protein